MVNVDGATGPHWTQEQTETVREQRGIQWDPAEFWITMNMIYSDYSEVFREYGVRDKIFLYADMARAFLEDADAKPGKLSRYYRCVVGAETPNAEPQKEAEVCRMNWIEKEISGPKSARMCEAPRKALTKEMAQNWASNMRNADGSMGPHWSIDQIKRVMAQMSIGGDPYRFWVAINEVYSRLGPTLEKYGVNSIEAYVDIVKAFWLSDKSAVDDKLTAYYEHVLKH